MTLSRILIEMLVACAMLNASPARAQAPVSVEERLDACTIRVHKLSVDRVRDEQEAAMALAQLRKQLADLRRETDEQKKAVTK